ncbi:sensor histidine kinase [Embleya scabrispora]|nr:sensor histidine kinase [Embleya scabrispora]
MRWLRVGVASALVVLAALGVLGAWVFVHSTGVNGRLVDRSTPALIASARLEAAFVDQETGIRGYALTGKPEYLLPYEQGRIRQEAQLRVLRRVTAADSRAREDLAVVLAHVEGWRTLVADPIVAAPPGIPVPEAADRQGAAKAAFDELRAATATQQAHLQADRDHARGDLDDVRLLRTWVFAGIAAVIVLLALLVFEGLRRGVTRPVAGLVHDAERVAHGDFAHPITELGPADIRALAHAMEAMRRRLADELAFADRARRRLDEQALDLRRSNAELEQFAYVASHDLQEPLRKVASFCGLLQKRYSGQLDERADQYIHFAVDGATRMQTLISDLLKFSRVGRVDTKVVDVDLESVFTTVVDDIAVAIQESDARIEHDPLPRVQGDPTQLALLLQNLLVNAIKFRDLEHAPLLRMSVERDGRMWRFALTDNGIGIAPEYADRIFVVFQRLHTREAYPGNGIGLAMCKKIVEFHGGRIHLDPDHTEGTRIVFTLPADA